MKSILSRFLIAAMALSIPFVTGCERHSHSESYYLVSANVKLPYWQSASAGLLKAAAQYGVTAELRGPDNYDPKAEADEFRAVVARKPAGILVSAADPAIMQPEIDAAIAAGIPVITVDSDAPTSRRLYFIGTNNLQAGRLGGQSLATRLHGKGGVVFFTMPGQVNLDERLKGYEDVLADHPDIKVVGVIDIRGQSTIAFDKTQEYLAHTGADKVDAFVCLEASAGKDVAEVFKRNKASDRLLIAMDVDEDTLNLVKDGTIGATVAQKPFTMAYVGLKALDDIHHYPVKSLGKAYSVDSFSPFPAFIDTGVSLVDKSNVDMFLASRNEAQAK